MFYVNILYSEIADRYYVGYCSELSAILDKHNAGAINSTKPYRPWIMVYTESWETKSEAIQSKTPLKNLVGGNALCPAKCF